MNSKTQANSKPILITGANGHIGVRLIRKLAPERSIVAMVRSTRARDQLLESLADLAIEVRVVDYADAQALAGCVAACDQVVHLVGIIRESAGNTFVAAHEETTAALIGACAASSVRRIVHLSLVGADPGSANPCLASRGRTDAMLLGAETQAIVLRIPMVLGEEDYASAALRKRGTSSLCTVFRADSLEQPIYAGDVVLAVERILDLPGDTGKVLDLAGPECLTRRALIQRAGAVCGCRPRVMSLPIGLGYLLAGLLEWLLPQPPVSRAMLGVLDHDDKVDNQATLDLLGLELTPLDAVLGQCLRRVESR